MQIRHIALLISITTAITLAPTIGAVPLGCTEADAAGDNSMLAPPSAERTNWASDCAHINNGGTLRIQSLDPLSSHGAVLQGCFDLGNIDVTGTQTLKVAYSAEENIIYTEQNGQLSTCESGATITGSTITIDFQCSVHGDQMPAKLIIAL